MKQVQGPGPGLLLVGLGGGEDAAVAAAELLAPWLRLPLCRLARPAEPDACLQELGGRPGAWLAPLPLDVGRPLAPGGSWAEALGAWRQPVALTIPAAQLSGGLPAAGTALLQRWRAPLLGLLQWQGAWDPAARRRDGLPWLGMLAEGPAGEAAAACLLQRWRRTTAELA